MDLKKLEEEIWHQMRNGRKEVYLRVCDINYLLGCGEEYYKRALNDLGDDTRKWYNGNEVLVLIDKFRNRKDVVKEHDEEER